MKKHISKEIALLQAILDAVMGTFLWDVFKNMEEGKTEEIKVRRKKGEEKAGKMLPFQRALHATLIQYARRIAGIINCSQAILNSPGIYRQKIQELEELNDKTKNTLDFMRKNIKNSVKNPKKKIAMRSNHKLVLLPAANVFERESDAYQWAKASEFLSIINIKTGEIKL